MPQLPSPGVLFMNIPVRQYGRPTWKTTICWFLIPELQAYQIELAGQVDPLVLQTNRQAIGQASLVNQKRSQEAPNTATPTCHTMGAGTMIPSTYTMSPTIRVAQPEDSQGMRRCSLRVLPSCTQFLDHYIRILSSWPGLSHVAVNDKGRIVGICLVRLKEEVTDATHAHVSSLCMLPEYQKQGLGRRLLTASLQSARTLFNVSEVTLHVSTSNEPAIKLYTSLKFYTTEMKPKYYDDGEDAFAMNLLLSNDVNT